MSDDISFYQEAPSHIAAAKVRSSIDYDSFIEGVYGLLDYAKDVCQTSNNIIYSSEGAEDSITHSIINYLRPFGANIGMMQSGGGNADLVIKNNLDNLKWVGEAKILSDDNSSKHVFEGLLQLATRYSNACRTEQHGGLLIYNFKERLDRCVANWDLYLFSHAGSSGFEGLKKVDLSHLNTFNGFFTEHTHHTTGEKYTVAHIPINFFKNQLDKSARNRKSD